MLAPSQGNFTEANDRSSGDSQVAVNRGDGGRLSRLPGADEAENRVWPPIDELAELFVVRVARHVFCTLHALVCRREHLLRVAPYAVTTLVKGSKTNCANESL